jgi:hypothetical protein
MTADVDVRSFGKPSSTRFALAGKALATITTATTIDTFVMSVARSVAMSFTPAMWRIWKKNSARFSPVSVFSRFE